MSEIRGEKVSFGRNEITPLHMMPSAQAEDPIIVHCPPRRGRTQRIGRILVILVLLLLAAAGSAFFAIEGGAVDGTLSARANDALNNALGLRYRATVGSAAIRFDSDFRLALEARDVHIIEQASGQHLSQAAVLRMAVDPLALAAGRISIRHMEAGGIQLDTGALPQGDPMVLAKVRVDALPEALEQAFQRLDEARGLMERTGTDTISLSGINILLPSAPGRTPVALEVSSLDLTRAAPGEIFVRGSISLDDQTAELQATAAVIDGVSSSLTAKLKGLDVTPFLLRRADDGAPRDGVQGTVDVALSAVRDREITAPAINLTLTQSPGLFYFDGIDQELSGGVINATFDFDKQSLELVDSEMRFGTTVLPLSGAILDLNRLDATETRPGFGVSLLVSGGTATAAGSGEAPAIFDLRAAGKYLSAEREVELNDILLSSPLGSVAGSLMVRFGNASPEISFGGQLPVMQVAGVKQFWPFWMARKPREWVLEQLYGGTVTNGSIAVFIPAGRMQGPGHPLDLDANELRISFGIDDARINLPGDIPPLRDVNGMFDLKGEVMKVQVKKAASYFPSGRSVSVSDGTFDIASTYSKPLMADLSLNVSGPADAVAELANFHPLNGLKNTEFKPKDFSGTASAAVHARLGLISDHDPPEPVWSADIALTDVALGPEFAGRQISDVDGKLSVDPQAARLTANAAIDGVPAQVTLVEPVGKNSPVAKERIIKAVLDNQQREKLVPGLSDIIDGTIGAEITRLDETRQNVSLDLTRSALSVPWIGWTKGSGIPAKASFEVASDGKTDSISNFKLDGEGFGADGEMMLSGGSLQSAQFSRLKLSPSDDYRVSLKQSRGAFDVSVSGTSADMRPVLTKLRSTGGGNGDDKGSGNARIKVDLDRMIGFNDEQLLNVSILFETKGDTIATADFSAVTTSGAAVVSQMVKGNTISITSGDAGAVARFTNLYNRIKGGLLNVAVRAQSNDLWSGSVDLRNFSLINESRLQSIVSTPVGEQGRSLNAAVKRDIDVSSAKFQRGFARVVYRDGVLSVENGIVRGEQIGASFQGVVRDAAGSMDMTGTFMPAYGLNRLFAELPIIGAILGNGRDRGLLGITFKLEGPFEQPRLTVNPLSIIAPGIFRQIFEFQ
ncbi:hypothetical protein ABID21_000892 [Pseudorhizobium tarimense]|uniref:DUF3971 domain-containing protein n=1 Tax=Pseudorhizobium tarimense TaxID=1079109 RepID=A0ABV2H2R1_9HYPH|nr:DUF3971 domain-containing protein [Pseudorhizobium tarimense]MCJ8518212.1 hypothetical protein [Pseudorhizobium tarimense]